MLSIGLAAIAVLVGLVGVVTQNNGEELYEQDDFQRGKARITSGSLLLISAGVLFGIAFGLIF